MRGFPQTRQADLRPGCRQRSETATATVCGEGTVVSRMPVESEYDGVVRVRDGGNLAGEDFTSSNV